MLKANYNFTIKVLLFQASATCIQVAHWCLLNYVKIVLGVLTEKLQVEFRIISVFSKCSISNTNRLNSSLV